MAINPLQLPGPLVVPTVDFTPLSRIGQMLGEQRQQEKLAAAGMQYVDALGAGTAQPQQPQQPQQATPGMPPPVNDLTDTLAKIAQNSNINPATFIKVAQIESNLNPQARNGRYSGLFQLDPEDFAKRGGRDISNPVENATIAAQRLAENNTALTRRLGREPTPTELYLSHQQGLGGLSAYMVNPDRPAWQAMASTGEGRQRGEAWAKQAVWGNIPDSEKARFGSVDNVSAGDFLNLWKQRIEGAPQQAQQPPTQARSGMSPADAAYVRQLYSIGSPEANRRADAIVERYRGKQEPIKLSEGDVLVDPNNYRTIARGPEKTQRGFEPKVVTVKDRETGVERSMIFDPRSGRLTEVNETPRSGTQPAEPLPPGVDPAVVRRERSEALVKNEQAAVESARSAAQLQPLIDEAVRSYEKAHSLGAIGPIVGNSIVRGANQFVLGTEGERARQSYDRALAAIQAWRTGLQNKGQGALSDFERKMYAMQYPTVQDLDPADQIKFLKQIQAETQQTVKAGRSSTLGRQPSVVTERPPVGQQGAPVRVNSPAEAARLPPGTRFIDPNGVERIRP